MKKIKDFIITSGEIIVTVIVGVVFIVDVIMSIVLMSTMGFFIGAGFFVMVLIGLILAVFVLYILLDIRDNLKQLNEKTTK